MYGEDAPGIRPREGGRTCKTCAFACDVSQTRHRISETGGNTARVQHGFAWDSRERLIFQNDESRVPGQQCLERESRVLYRDVLIALWTSRALLLPVWTWERPLGAIISDLDVSEVEVGHKIWRKQLLVVPGCLFSQKLLTCALRIFPVAVSFSRFNSSLEPQTLTQPYSVLEREEREFPPETSLA